MKGIGDPDSMPVWYVGGIGMFVAIAVVIAVVAYYRAFEQGIVDERVTQVPYTQFVDVASEQSRALNSYGWADEEKTVVRIPIEKAMEMVAVEAER